MIIRDIDAVGFQFNGDNLCRYCTHDVLEQIVYENAYRMPDELHELGIVELMMICQEPEGVPEMVVSGTWSYNTEAYDSDDFPKPFEDVEFEGERCTNPECEQKLELVYNETVRDR